MPNKTKKGTVQSFEGFLEAFSATFEVFAIMRQKISGLRAIFCACSIVHNKTAKKIDKYQVLVQKCGPKNRLWSRATTMSKIVIPQ